MSVPLKDLYALYAELEGVPAQAAADVRMSAEDRASAIRDVETSIESTVRAYNRKKEEAQKAEKSSSAALERQLRTIAQSASAKGSIPVGGAARSGRPPAFPFAKAMDDSLGGMLADKRRLETELDRLEEQLAHGLGLNAAKRGDVISGIFAGVAALLSVAAGANWAAVAIAFTMALFIVFRVTRGPSLFIRRRRAKMPSLSYDKRKRSSLMGVVGAAYIALTLAITAVANFFLIGILPQIHSSFGRWSPDPAFWAAGVVSLIAMGVSYRRLGGR